MISPQKHDYISFTRRVIPAVKQKVRGAYNSNHDYVLEDENWQACAGRGYVLSVSKNSKLIRGELCRTVKVDAGFELGTIYVILDDTCEIVGEQNILFDVSRDEKHTSMYGTDGSHA